MKSLLDLIANLPGHNPNAMRADEVSACLAQLACPVDSVEHLPLAQALGRVLAQDLLSPLNVPPHDNSAMDGYAFDGAQLQPGQPLQLRVVGKALAGSPWQGEVQAGECVRIMTGAVMPAGLDTVVPQELVQVHVESGGDTIHLPADAVQSGDNRRLAGEDLQAGQPALRQGQVLTPAALGLIASLGLADVSVQRRLRVAYASTGNEILSPGQPPREGAVYDSNRHTITAMLRRLGCEVLDLGVIPDDPAALQAALREAAKQADVIVTSGGVSVGEADHTRTALQALGEVLFWHLAIRPGRPLAVGRINARAPFAAAAGELPESAIQYLQADPARRSPASGPDEDSALFFGLPGNPVAAAVTFIMFVRPALRRMMGQQLQPDLLLPARAEQALRKKPGRTEYQRGILTRHPDGQLSVRSTGAQGSGVLSSLVQANALIVLEHEQGPVAAGDAVSVLPLGGLWG